jgi:hypothetical protein
MANKKKSNNDGNNDSKEEDESDIGKMNVAQLKAELKKKGLNTSGKKAHLIKRLQGIRPPSSLSLCVFLFFLSHSLI